MLLAGVEYLLHFDYWSMKLFFRNRFEVLPVCFIPNSFKLCLELFYFCKKTRGGDKNSLQKNTAAPYCLPQQKEAALHAGCIKAGYHTFFHLSTHVFGSPSIHLPLSQHQLRHSRPLDRDNLASLLPIESFRYLRFFLFNFLFWNAFFIICKTFVKANY